MPVTGLLMNPGTEGGVGDDLPWSDGALGDLLLVLMDYAGEHLGSDGIEKE